MKKLFLVILLLTVAGLLTSCAGMMDSQTDTGFDNQTQPERKYPQRATVGGKYSGFKQKIRCPRDRNRYGSFRDYGFWRGGRWCGKRGKRGYWVWVAPNWYVFAHRRGGGRGEGSGLSRMERASVRGKYSGLRQTIHCPRDRRTYGRFRDYGFWGGGRWCGRRGKRGYWVWVYPKWYVWRHRN